jgi:hypothetical protein
MSLFIKNHSQKIYWNASMLYRAMIAEAAEVCKGLGSIAFRGTSINQKVD